MASKSKQTPTPDIEYAQRFPDWVHQVPGAFLIIFGFGGLVFLSIT